VQALLSRRCFSLDDLRFGQICHVTVVSVSDAQLAVSMRVLRSCGGAHGTIALCRKRLECVSNPNESVEGRFATERERESGVVRKPFFSPRSGLAQTVWKPFAVCDPAAHERAVSASNVTFWWCICVNSAIEPLPS